MSLDSFHIADASEASAIAALVNAAYRPSDDPIGWTHEAELIAGDRTSPQQVAEAIKRPNSVVLIHREGATIIACVHVEKDGSHGHIGMLAVAPALQTAGIGKQMLMWAERYAAEMFGAEKFILAVVSARRELVAFYARRGYQKTGVVMDYPVSARAGVPKDPALSVEWLEKKAFNKLRPQVGLSQSLNDMAAGREVTVYHNAE
jgi:ribosomal protein S18 acetylase RimI-like enzyme